jgi:hypothetical protein
MHVMDHLATMSAGTPLGRHVSVDQRGRMPRYVLCHGCGFLSLSEDRFASVQVPIKGCKDLEDALGSMILPEVLCGSNQYSCQGCSSMQDASLGRYFDGELVIAEQSLEPRCSQTRIGAGTVLANTAWLGLFVITTWIGFESWSWCRRGAPPDAHNAVGQV